MPDGSGEAGIGFVVHDCWEEDLGVLGKFGAAEDGEEVPTPLDAYGFYESAVQALEVRLVTDRGGERVVGDIAVVRVWGHVLCCEVRRLREI